VEAPFPFLRLIEFCWSSPPRFVKVLDPAGPPSRPGGSLGLPFQSDISGCSLVPPPSRLAFQPFFRLFLVPSSFWKLPVLFFFFRRFCSASPFAATVNRLLMEKNPHPFPPHCLGNFPPSWDSLTSNPGEGVRGRHGRLTVSSLFASSLPTDLPSHFPGICLLWTFGNPWGCVFFVSLFWFFGLYFFLLQSGGNL